MNYQEKDDWRDSRNVCEYIAEALGYDNDEWANPDDFAAIWEAAAAAAAALAAGEDENCVLYWGCESRAIREL